MQNNISLTNSVFMNSFEMDVFNESFDPGCKISEQIFIYLFIPDCFVRVGI